MARPLPFGVEVHFVPLPADEAEERRRRLRALLLRGALRFVQQRSDRNQEPGKHEAAEVQRIDLVQK